MPRSIWEGHITFGLVAIPVGVFPAEDSQARISFRQIDRRSMSPVHLLRVDDAGNEVPWEEIVKGYELEDGSFVTLTAEDFQQANVEATRTIEIIQTTCVEEIDPVFYSKPYYLSPSAKGGEKPFALLREALRSQKRAAVARVVLRTREHAALVYPKDAVLVLELMRFPYELQGADHLDLPGDLTDLGITEKELDLANRLVEELSSAWDPDSLRDTYHDDLLALIDEKRAAGEAYSPPPLPPRGEPAEVVDLMSALKASLKQGRRSDAEAG